MARFERSLQTNKINSHTLRKRVIQKNIRKRFFQSSLCRRRHKDIGFTDTYTRTYLYERVLAGDSVSSASSNRRSRIRYRSRDG